VIVEIGAEDLGAIIGLLFILVVLINCFGDGEPAAAEVRDEDVKMEERPKLSIRVIRTDGTPAQGVGIGLD
jgi:hypothetical protein